eukprot:UC4_evm1s1580
MTEFERAREVAKKALKTISFRDEGEKMNVWIAMMNMEAIYGDEDSLERVFEEAYKSNDPKKTYFGYLGVLQRSKKLALADKCIKAMCKKLKDDTSVWIRVCQHFLEQGQTDNARKYFERSLKMLPKPQHVDMIMKFGLLEFRIGDRERARTIFESILSSFPKRVDIWNVFIDQELRCGDKAIIRDLFERVTAMNLSSKKMKYFFKRYLEYENTEGDDTSIEHVKQRAREYVEAKSR